MKRVKARLRPFPFVYKGRRDLSWVPLVPSVVVSVLGLVGVLFHASPNWRFFNDAVLATALLCIVVAFQSQSRRNARKTATQIEELLKLLRGSKNRLSAYEAQKMQISLQELQIDVLRRAGLKK